MDHDNKHQVFGSQNFESPHSHSEGRGTYTMLDIDAQFPHDLAMSIRGIDTEPPHNNTASSPVNPNSLAFELSEVVIHALTPARVVPPPMSRLYGADFEFIVKLVDFGNGIATSPADNSMDTERFRHNTPSSPSNTKSLAAELSDTVVTAFKSAGITPPPMHLLRSAEFAEIVNLIDYGNGLATSPAEDIDMNKPRSHHDAPSSPANTKSLATELSDVVVAAFKPTGIIPPPMNHLRSLDFESMVKLIDDGNELSGSPNNIDTKPLSPAQTNSLAFELSEAFLAALNPAGITPPPMNRLYGAEFNSIVELINHGHDVATSLSETSTLLLEKPETPKIRGRTIAETMMSGHVETTTKVTDMTLPIMRPRQYEKSKGLARYHCRACKSPGMYLVKVVVALLGFAVMLEGPLFFFGVLMVMSAAIRHFA